MSSMSNQLSEIRPRRRQQTDRPQSFDRATFNSAQENFDFGSAANQQGRRRVLCPCMMKRPRIAKMSVSKAQRAQRKHFQKPVENDSDLAEKETAIDIGRHENVIENQQRDGQHRSRAQNIQRIRQRNKAPFRGGQIEGVANDNAKRDEIRKNAQQKRQAIQKRWTTLEAQIKTGKNRKRRRERVVNSDQQVTMRKI